MRKRGLYVLTMLAILFLGGCTGSTAAGPQSQSSPVRLPGPEQTLPEVSLPAPASAAELDYLGLAGGGNFSFGDIKADAIIVEFFNMYCPFCQREAPNVNALFQAMEKRPEIRDRIKIIGIGLANSSMEVDLYREKYGVGFPLFSDPDKSISKLLDVSRTPSFLIVAINRDGSSEERERTVGPLGDVSEFLDRALQVGGIRP